MSQFITLKKSDTNFKKYLYGTFSQDQIAVPVSTLNLGSIEETITFEIKKKSDIQKPMFIILILNIIKIKKYLLILIPLFYVLAKNYVDGRMFDVWSLFLATLGTLFLFAGVNIRNDVIDHITGYDRVNTSEELKPIQEGWVTAADALFISRVFILIAALFSIPVMIYQPEAAHVIVALIGLILAGKLFVRNSYKNQHFGELLLFIISGAGLVSGYQVALGAGIDTEVLVFGVLWGWSVLFLMHLNNFRNLLSSSQAGIKNTITRLGFDRAKKLLNYWWIVFLILWFTYHHFYGSVFWSTLSNLILVFWSIPTLIKISQIQSPLGSDLIEAKLAGYKNFLLMNGILILEFGWYVGTKNSWTI